MLVFRLNLWVCCRLSWFVVEKCFFPLHGDRVLDWIQKCKSIVKFCVDEKVYFVPSKYTNWGESRTLVLIFLIWIRYLLCWNSLNFFLLRFSIIEEHVGDACTRLKTISRSVTREYGSHLSFPHYMIYTTTWYPLAQFAVGRVPSE